MSDNRRIIHRVTAADFSADLPLEVREEMAAQIEAEATAWEETLVDAYLTNPDLQADFEIHAPTPAGDDPVVNVDPHDDEA